MHFAFCRVTRTSLCNGHGGGDSARNDSAHDSHDEILYPRPEKHAGPSGTRVMVNSTRTVNINVLRAAERRDSVPGLTKDHSRGTRIKSLVRTKLRQQVLSSDGHASKGKEGRLVAHREIQAIPDHKNRHELHSKQLSHHVGSTIPECKLPISWRACSCYAGRLQHPTVHTQPFLAASRALRRTAQAERGDGDLKFFMTVKIFETET